MKFHNAVCNIPKKQNNFPRIKPLDAFDLRLLEITTEESKKIEKMKKKKSGVEKIVIIHPDFRREVRYVKT